MNSTNYERNPAERLSASPDGDEIEEPQTWAEKVRPYLQEALRLVDKAPVDWGSAQAEARAALTQVPIPKVPVAVTIGMPMPTEFTPAVECRAAITDFLEKVSREEYDAAVPRLQDAWQHAEKDEGL